MSGHLKPDKRGKREVEKLLVSEFLDSIGLRNAGVQQGESPDFRVEWSDGTGTHAVGIEITEYQVDQPPKEKGGSPARQASALQERTIKVAQRLCAARYPELRRLEVRLALEHSDLPRKHDIERLAEEIVEYLASKKNQIGEQPKCLSPLPDDATSSAFPLVHKHLGSITANLPASRAGLWYPGDAAFVGIVESVILDILDRKAKSREGYDCGELDECWLVVCASGETAHDSAGPELCRGDLRSSSLLDAAGATGFDHVYF